MPKTNTPCEHCGKEMEYFTSTYAPSGRKRFCSRRCQMAATRAWTVCPYCGKIFWYHLSRPRKFCSKACSNAVNAKANLGIVELPPMFCEVCGQEILEDKRAARRFCSQSCFGKWLSRTRYGPNHHNYNSVERTCEWCSETFMAPLNEVEKGWARFCSHACKGHWQSVFLVGEANPCWRGGREEYYGPDWLNQRRLALNRDGYTCQRCGATGNDLTRALDVHHIRPFREFGLERHIEANDLANLVSLCRSCHFIVEVGGRR